MVEIPKEVQTEINSIIKVQQKFIQAFNLRNKIMKKRTEALESLTSELSNEVKNQLSFCNRNEKRLMEVLRNSRKPTFDMLHINLKKIIFYGPQIEIELTKLLGRKIKISHLNAIFDEYKSLIRLFYKKYRFIQSRLKLEGDFLDSPTSKNKKRYLKKLNKELIFQKNINSSIMKIKERGVTPNTSLFRITKNILSPLFASLFLIMVASGGGGTEGTEAAEFVYKLMPIALFIAIVMQAPKLEFVLFKNARENIKFLSDNVN